MDEPLSHYSEIRMSSRARRLARAGRCGGRDRVLGGVLDGLHDVVISSAAAEITLQGVTDFSLRRIWISLQKLHRGDHHPGRAKSALETMLFPKSFLHRTELAIF